MLSPTTPATLLLTCPLVKTLYSLPHPTTQTPTTMDTHVGVLALDMVGNPPCSRAGTSNHQAGTSRDMRQLTPSNTAQGMRWVSHSIQVICFHYQNNSATLIPRRASDPCQCWQTAFCLWGCCTSCQQRLSAAPVSSALTCLFSIGCSRCNVHCNPSNQRTSAGTLALKLTSPPSVCTMLFKLTPTCMGMQSAICLLSFCSSLIP